MNVSLNDYQLETVDNLKNGSILCGGVGSGKSRTAIAYYLTKVCKGSIPINGYGDYSKMSNPHDLYIITTARKRDTLEWEEECLQFGITKKADTNLFGVHLAVDSWNNIGKYTNVLDGFFIFDEQRVVGSGAWVKSFLKITKYNKWLLLSATPGDTWIEYAPVFIANGYYKNRTDFLRQHVVFNGYTKFQMIDHYVNTSKLKQIKRDILVNMASQKHTDRHTIHVVVDYDKAKVNLITKDRWNPITQEPIKDVSEYCAVMRKIVITSGSRTDSLIPILQRHKRIIVFYNYNYELTELLSLSNKGYTVAQYNGHKHEPIPSSESWIYLVQYNSGAEGWNCIKTNAIVFYSLNYSYKIMEQSAGRIDRLNTPYTDLYYYIMYSKAKIDQSVIDALRNKRTFNEKTFAQRESA